MKMHINGEEKTIADNITLAQLLEELEFGGKHVAVERNKMIVSFRTYHDVVLQDGDFLEIVTLVGGG